MEERIMNHIFYNDGMSASNGGAYITKVCVDRKVHITLSSNWYDPGDEENNAYDTVSYGGLVPCDGSCLPTCVLPDEANELVIKFLASDGKERGTYKLKTPRLYPDGRSQQRLIHLVSHRVRPIRVK